MPTRVFKVADFARFSRRARIPDAALLEAVERAERGLADADLGGGVYKLRIARPNEGRSGGFRTIVALVVGDRAFFMFGYAKNDVDNVPQSALRNFRLVATRLQGLGDDALAADIEAGEILEIER